MLFTQFLVEAEDSLPPQESEKPEVVPAVQKPRLQLRQPRNEPFPRFEDKPVPFKGVPHHQVADRIKQQWERDNPGRKIEDWRNIFDENSFDPKRFESDDHIRRHAATRLWDNYAATAPINPGGRNRDNNPSFNHDMGSTFRATNDFLRNGYRKPDKDIRPYLHRMIQSSHEPNPFWEIEAPGHGGGWWPPDNNIMARSFYRGLLGSDYDGDDNWRPLFGYLRPGDVLYDPGFQSMTSDFDEAAHGYTEGEDNGHPGIFMDIFGPSDENEYQPPTDHHGYYRKMRKGPGTGERVMMPNLPLTYRGRGNPDDFQGIRPYLFDMPGYNRTIPDDYPKRSIYDYEQ